jgi:8-oxo-dGTP diphosphatase
MPKFKPRPVLTRIDAALALVTREGPAGIEVLLVWNADWRTPSWSLPGGKREDGETLAEAAVRETYEETGLLIDVGDLVTVQEIVGLGRHLHIVFFTFRAQVIGGTLVADGQAEPVPGEVVAARWFPLDDARRALAWSGNVDPLSLSNCGAHYRVERRKPYTRPRDRF